MVKTVSVLALVALFVVSTTQLSVTSVSTLDKDCSCDDSRSCGTEFKIEKSINIGQLRLDIELKQLQTDGLRLILIAPSGTETQYKSDHNGISEVDGRTFSGENALGIWNVYFEYCGVNNIIRSATIIKASLEILDSDTVDISSNDDVVDNHKRHHVINKPNGPTGVAEMNDINFGFNENSCRCGPLPLACNFVLTMPLKGSGKVEHVSLGVVGKSTYRGDIRFTLLSPDGTRRSLIQNKGGGSDDFNVRFIDGGGNWANDQANPAPVTMPYYLVDVQPEETLSQFIGENAAGSWTFEFCDSFGGDSHIMQQLKLEVQQFGQGTRTPTITPGSPTKAPTTAQPSKSPTVTPTPAPLAQSVALYPGTSLADCCNAPYCTVTLPNLGQTQNIESVTVGLDITVDRRSRIRATLNSPGSLGPISTIFSNFDGSSGSNFNVLFSDTGGVSLASLGTTDMTGPPSNAPYSEATVTPSNSFSPLLGLDSVGTWDVVIQSSVCTGSINSVTLTVNGPIRTGAPTKSPTVPPTNSKAPTPWPTHAPTNTPTVNPSNAPSSTPTVNPTQSPSVTPTAAPSKTPTTATPTVNPTASPTVMAGLPTKMPTTRSPTQAPSNSPSVNPTSSPTASPTLTPSQAPSVTPTQSPTATPTVNPTQSPSTNPTVAPSNAPSVTPTTAPSKAPSKNPSQAPTWYPTKSPSKTPTKAPTKGPSKAPTPLPTRTPSIVPTPQPTFGPTKAPTTKSPTKAPSKSPTPIPTDAPSKTPTPAPTPAPLVFKTCLTGDTCFCGSAYDCQCLMPRPEGLMAIPTHCNCENAVNCNCSNHGGNCYGGNALKVTSPGIDNDPGDVYVDCQNAVVCQPVTQERYSLSEGAVAGIVIGAAVLVAGIIILLFVVLRKGAKSTFAASNTGRARGQSRMDGDITYDS